jgi:phosphohistidine phosphatase SixA
MTVYLVRHAVAVGRRAWDGPDRARPLTPKGERQAAALPGLLEDASVGRVLSSPAVRCRDTLGPLAEATGLEVEAVDELAEGADPASAVDLLEALAGEGADTVLCTHGDLIPEVLRHLTRQGARLEGDLQFAKGSTWELVVDDGAVVGGRYHPPAE